MNVLVACEESQAVCKAFREKGHRAFSCDIQECSGGHPEWHIKHDVLEIIRGGALPDNGWNGALYLKVGSYNCASTMHIFINCGNTMPLGQVLFA